MEQYTIEFIATAMSWIVVAICVCVQIRYCISNIRKLKIVRNFFSKEKNYEVYGEDENAQLSHHVAAEGSQLYSLIVELNRYTRKNHGTTDFSIIQNKTERKIEILYEDAISRLAFPIYIGLMGTFAGVFCGLFFFYIGLGNSANGISDEAIRNLIKGVLVSMATSFIGLLLSTGSNHYASNIKRNVDQDKNEFFEFIQNELMPTLGVSMVAALNKLHHTINLFEPSFNRVIDRFQTTFDSCTQRFGNAFEQNVTVVSEAVCVMGENMDKINENVDLQAQLLKTLRSRGVMESLDAFVGAAQNFDLVTTAIDRFEVTHNAIKDVAIELINTQRQYNESLEVPLSVANKLNGILTRVTDFEKSINALGKSINCTQLLGNSEIELVKEQVTAIKKKQEVAMQYIEISDGRLEDIFKLQNEAIIKLNRQFEISLAGYAEKFENVLAQLATEMQSRRAEIVAAIEEKFSLEQIQQDFSQLSKLKKIEELLTSIDKQSSSEEVEKALETTNSKVQSIYALLDKVIQEAEKQTNNNTQSPDGNRRMVGWPFWRT